MNEPQGTIQLPPQLSTYAAEVDWLYYFLYWLSVVFFVAVVGAMLYFVVKYRRREGVAPKPTGHNTPLEVFWTFTPLVLLWFLFAWGFDSYVKAAVAPKDAIDIRVRGAQWNWEFEYPSGATEGNEVWVPVGEPVRLVMSSKDVLHSFFVPAFRVKKDVVPGMYTTMWFEATQTGDVQIYCTEYCGAPEGGGNVGHSAMLGKIRVVTKDEYESHVRSLDSVPDGMSPAEYGEQLYVSNGCNACHKVDGETMQPAPNWVGLWGKQRAFADGTSAVADENYIRTSILQPQAKVVEGYANVVMPPYALRDFQIDSIIAYIKQLSGADGEGAGAAEGAPVEGDGAGTSDGDGGEASDAGAADDAADDEDATDEAAEAEAEPAGTDA